MGGSAGKIVNVLTNVATGGLLGWENGGLSAGETTKLGARAVGEVTGVAAMTRQMEEELKQAEARALEEKENMERLRREELLATERADRVASARAASTRRSNTALGINTGNFLGL